MKTIKKLFEMMPQTMKHNYMACSFADFFDCYHWIYEHTSCLKKKEFIASIIFPLFREQTGFNYSANIFQAFGILNPKK